MAKFRGDRPMELEDLALKKNICSKTRPPGTTFRRLDKQANKAQIPLRRLCDKVRDKFPTKSRTCRGHKSWKSATQITSPTFMICVRELCRELVPDFVADFAANFPVHCNGLNSIRATETGLSRTCHGLCRKHLDMSRWCVGDFHRNFMVSWFVTVCVHDFPRGKVSVKVGVMEFGLKQAYAPRRVWSFRIFLCRNVWRQQRE